MLTGPMDDHAHCTRCFSSTCISHDGCTLEECPDCSTLIHACKLSDHSNETCGEAVIPCINAQYGCSVEMKRKQKVVHLQNCPILLDEITPSNVVTCENCSIPVCVSDKEDHEKVCLEAPVVCSNKSFGCVKRMERKQLNHHLEHCPASVIACNYGYSRPIMSSNEDHFGIGKLFNDEYEPETPDEKFLLSDTRKRDIVTPCRTSDHYEMATYRILLPIYTSKQPSFPDCYCFEHVRRDEFSEHWRAHIDFIDDLHLIVRRCPLFKYGCLHSIVQYQPSPRGYQLDYNPDLSSFIILPPRQTVAEGQSIVSQYVTDLAKKQELLAYGYGEDIRGSIDVLGQLPTNVLLLIFSFCDSLSLWSLSQVNHYFRLLCQEEVVLSKGIIIDKWTKEGIKWKSGMKVCVC